MFRAQVLSPLLMLVLTLAWLPGCSKVDVETKDTNMRFGQVRLFSTQNQARGVVFLFSDAAGWNDDLTDDAEELAHAGAVVIGVDLPTYQTNLKASDDGCHYLISEVEELSKEIQRQFHFNRYRTPLLAGVGEGGTLAYAALSQSPHVTVGAAVAVDPVPVLNTKVPLCPGAVGSASGSGFTYTTAELPDPWSYAFTKAPTPGPMPWATPDHAQKISWLTAWLNGSRLRVLLQPMLTSAGKDPAGLDDLPLTPLTAAQNGDTLAIIISGDGGWRDIDETIGQELTKGQIAVVGWDSLRYFWDARSPQQVAQDLTRVITAYGQLWNRPRVLLIGYSFGADILPTTYNLLAPDIKARVKQITLLGFSGTADFQFHVDGWLGLESGSALPTRAEIPKIEPSLLQCIYGDDDDEDKVCEDKIFDKAERIKMAGDHHYDGDYTALAQYIVDGWNRRSTQAP